MIGNYTALDLETTGLNPKYDKIIEVGAVKVRNGEIIDRFQQMVCPGIALPEKITGLTGQKAVEQDLPDVAQNDTADKVRQEKDGTEHIGAAHAAGQQQGNAEGQHIDQHGGHHGKGSGEPEPVEAGAVPFGT